MTSGGEKIGFISHLQVIKLYTTSFTDVDSAETGTHLAPLRLYMAHLTYKSDIPNFASRRHGQENRSKERGVQQRTPQ